MIRRSRGVYEIRFPVSNLSLELTALSKPQSPSMSAPTQNPASPKTVSMALSRAILTAQNV